MVAIPWILGLVGKGIRIVQLTPPEVVYDTDMDERTLMGMILDLSRGHGESKRKSGFLASAWDGKKKAAREGVPYGKQVPAWIELREGKYCLVEERARAVRLLILWTE